MFKLFSPLDLPCGVTLKNRIVKPAMSDWLGSGTGEATHKQRRLYARWTAGGVGLSIVGEVQVTHHCPEHPGNLVLDDSVSVACLEDITSSATEDGAQLWAQLGHAGFMVHPGLGEPVGPSTGTIGERQIRALTTREIESLPELYGRAAKRAITAGFTGVQIHAAHGFLLSQFLSPLFNVRTDRWGGSATARFRIVHAIIAGIRGAIGTRVPIGIKINVSDELVGGLVPDGALEYIELLNDEPVDLVELSAGTYVPGFTRRHTRARSGPYYQHVAAQARSVSTQHLVLTGGIKSRDDAEAIIDDLGIEAVGMARLLVLDPELPRSWAGDSREAPQFPRLDKSATGGVTEWYTSQIHQLAGGSGSKTGLTEYTRVLENRWRERFCP